MSSWRAGASRARRRRAYGGCGLVSGAPLPRDRGTAPVPEPPSGRLRPPGGPEALGRRARRPLSRPLRSSPRADDYAPRAHGKALHSWSSSRTARDRPPRRSAPASASKSDCSHSLEADRLLHDGWTRASRSARRVAKDSHYIEALLGAITDRRAGGAPGVRLPGAKSAFARGRGGGGHVHRPAARRARCVRRQDDARGRSPPLDKVRARRPEPTRRSRSTRRSGSGARARSRKRWGSRSSYKCGRGRRDVMQVAQDESGSSAR